MPVLIAPSILSARFTDVGAGIRRIEAAGADLVHLDVMDGSFVPPISFGSKMVADVRGLTALPLDVHLMIESPERHIQTFAEAGADYITVHAEACIHLHRLIQSLRSLGVKPGVSIVPSTPVAVLQEILHEIDLVLVMSVNPGYGGQSFIPRTLDKIRTLDTMKREQGLGFLISVDGGINRETAPAVREAGANLLVSGSAFFAADDPAREVRDLRDG